MPAWRGALGTHRRGTGTDEQINWRQKQHIHGELWLGSSDGLIKGVKMISADWPQWATGTAVAANGFGGENSANAQNAACGHTPTWPSNTETSHPEVKTTEAGAARKSTHASMQQRTGQRGDLQAWHFLCDPAQGGGQSTAKVTPMEEDPGTLGAKERPPQTTGGAAGTKAETKGDRQVKPQPAKAGPAVNGDTGSIGMTPSPRAVAGTATPNARMDRKQAPQQSTTDGQANQALGIDPNPSQGHSGERGAAATQRSSSPTARQGNGLAPAGEQTVHHAGMHQANGPAAEREQQQTPLTPPASETGRQASEPFPMCDQESAATVRERPSPKTSPMPKEPSSLGSGDQQRKGEQRAEKESATQRRGTVQPKQGAAEEAMTPMTQTPTRKSPSRPRNVTTGSGRNGRAPAAERAPPLPQVRQNGSPASQTDADWDGVKADPSQSHKHTTEGHAKMQSGPSGGDPVAHPPRGGEQEQAGGAEAKASGNMKGPLSGPVQSSALEPRSPRPTGPESGAGPQAREQLAERADPPAAKVSAKTPTERFEELINPKVSLSSDSSEEGKGSTTASETSTESARSASPPHQKETSQGAAEDAAKRSRSQGSRTSEKTDSKMQQARKRNRSYQQRPRGEREAPGSSTERTGDGGGKGGPQAGRAGAAVAGERGATGGARARRGDEGARQGSRGAAGPGLS